MKESSASTTVCRRPPRRLVIPSEIRRQLGIAPGDVLVAIVEDQRLPAREARRRAATAARRFAAYPGWSQSGGPR